ncbi:hypothetical protein LCGC14_2202490 [marine sediment metagenome]|uniref:Uncharacterized protein n=1 Tax=marine sediment metagenome TaxID=412755 RepID=A0A0F9GC50_9ZZZZ
MKISNVFPLLTAANSRNTRLVNTVFFRNFTLKPTSSIKPANLVNIRFSQFSRIILFTVKIPANISAFSNTLLNVIFLSTRI